MYHLMFSSSQEKGFLILWRLANLNMTSVKVFTYAIEQAFHQSTAKLDFFSFFWMIGLALQAGYR